MRENADAKGRRYIVEGRLTVRSVTPDEVIAVCKGSGQLHALGWRRQSGLWWCTCEARTRCSHLVALQLVTTARVS